jgi:hypothetical protein
MDADLGSIVSIYQWHFHCPHTATFMIDCPLGHALTNSYFFHSIGSVPRSLDMASIKK